ncbi:Pentatricopeptide repeat-containing protein [Ananas comosus]|uniref:Pentatricopeptide repeat-containing protein n=1 Tax=Ananas comosus TaxID=4615 RepID=A0A199UW12_ANACO|nr:Pentatricopeptide repeat-containing protein [Ananas comosus]
MEFQIIFSSINGHSTLPLQTIQTPTTTTTTTTTTASSSKLLHQPHQTLPSTPQNPQAKPQASFPSNTRLRRNGGSKDAILALEQGPIKPRPTFLLQSCIDSESIELGRGSTLGAAAVEGGADPFVGAKLVSMYAKCGSLDDARKVFVKCREKSLRVVGNDRRLRLEHRGRRLRLFARMLAKK